MITAALSIALLGAPRRKQAFVRYCVKVLTINRTKSQTIHNEQYIHTYIHRIVMDIKITI